MVTELAVANVWEGSGNRHAQPASRPAFSGQVAKHSAFILSL
jgi:hypothetical protein